MPSTHGADVKAHLLEIPRLAAVVWDDDRPEADPGRDLIPLVDLAESHPVERMRVNERDDPQRTCAQALIEAELGVLRETERQRGTDVVTEVMVEEDLAGAPLEFVTYGAGPNGTALPPARTSITQTFKGFDEQLPRDGQAALGVRCS